MVRKRALLLVSVLLLVAWGQLRPEPPRSELDALLRAAVDSKQVPPIVAMVGNRDGATYEGAVGTPANTIFAIASMTKPVTSVAVMQLVEAGKVKLDEPAETYVPALREVQVLEGGTLRTPKSRPTVRQLLSHMSGFAYEFSNPAIAEQVKAGRLASAFTGTDEFLRAPLVADPGVRWEYGISTDWLGRLVETISGETLEAYFRSHIFGPLQMTDTFFDVPAGKKSRLAQRYARQPDGTLAVLPPQPQAPSKFFSGGGGLHSTAADYLRFARALTAGGQLERRRLLKPETIALMATNQAGETMRPMQSLIPQFIVSNVELPGKLDAFGLGFGMNRKPLASGRGAGTMSWAGAFNTFFWVDRERNVCAVIMTEMLPFGDPAVLKLVQEFDETIYKRYPRASTNSR